MEEEIEYLTVKQFGSKYPWPTESALRAIILGAARKENNFKTAIKRVGRRVLIDVNEFWRLVKEQPQ